jgi:hypothetical protein
VSFKKLVLRIVAITLLIGGTVRILAGRALFEAAGIGALWTSEPYQIYIYKVLGAFVIFAGGLLLVISRGPEKYRDLLRGYALGFALIALVMSVTGLSLGLSPRYYMADPAYCVILVVVFWRAAK